MAEIAREVVAPPAAQAGAAGEGAGPARPRPPTALGDGVFATVDEAVEAAAAAQRRVQAMSLEERGRVIAVIRRLCDEHAAELGRRELEETGIGRLDHKIEKLRIVKNVLGVEALRIEARSDASGLCVIERAPWGVVGMVLPATHSAPDDGQQRHQRDRGRQHRGLQPAPGGLEGRRLRPADVQPRDRARDGRRRRDHHGGRAEHRVGGGDLQAPGRRPALRDRRSRPS